MRDKYLHIIILLSLISTYAYTQDLKDSLFLGKCIRKNRISQFDYIVSTNPLIMLWGSVPLSSEYRIMSEIRTGNKTSVNIGGAYLGKGLFFHMQDKAYNSIAVSSFALRGYRVQVMYKFYLSDWDTPPDGVYIGPYFSLAEAKLSYRQGRIANDYTLIRQRNYSFVLGYQYEAFNGFCWDMFVGIGYKDNEWIEYPTTNRFVSIPQSDMPEFYNSHIKYVIGLNIGYLVK